MSDLDNAIASLDALISAKLAGVSDLSDLFNQTLGGAEGIGITPASSLKELLDCRDRMVAASQQDNPNENWMVFL